jgi:hypothetical protein
MEGHFCTVVHTKNHFYVELILNLTSVYDKKKLYLILIDSMKGIDTDKKLNFALLRAHRILRNNPTNYKADDITFEYRTIDDYKQEYQQCGYFSIEFVKAVVSCYKDKKIIAPININYICEEIKTILNLRLNKEKNQHCIKNLIKEMQEHGNSCLLQISNSTRLRNMEHASNQIQPCITISNLAKNIESS